MPPLWEWELKCPFPPPSPYIKYSEMSAFQINFRIGKNILY